MYPSSQVKDESLDKNSLQDSVVREKAYGQGVAELRKDSFATSEGETPSTAKKYKSLTRANDILIKQDSVDKKIIPDSTEERRDGMPRDINFDELVN